MGDTFWLLVEIDRHSDDQFTLFQTEADALLAAGDFAAQYGERLRDWRGVKNHDGHWFASSDDGPKCQIRKITAQPARVECEEACQDALDTLISNELDTGWREIDEDGSEVECAE